ncbi:bifunctional UDP-N-acetylglucosamine diphosphorylase/glucosamine-1-phosphate N-acetyltransferase GlmU [Nocardioides yefusunii]|uniref:Bifunctional protein GlmU n=1 Tax=Nocardioides yefusunii TaxID=2500546 RepID=A0ABW1QUM5_9ACTN|nr:bifunctional UDP-N-acetylglucosamine diphosphorylase/glucosamine-1-phosphate N-acetyltransferase GlmU [Nocardioides yefusunii]
MENVTVIVLAAGGGTRMKSKTMKVLHPVAGRSMIGHVLKAVQAVEPQKIVAVVGHQREQVGPHITAIVPDAVLAVQETQDGTGHAVRVAVEAAGTASGTVLVSAGDTPMLRGESLREFVADHQASGRAVSILSGRVAKPFGYGRIVRDEAGAVVAIVEEKDATDEQRAIDEINSGILAFDAEFLLGALPRLSNDNANGEYYLTDTVKIALADGLAVGAHQVADVAQTEGANDRAQLAELGRQMNARIVTAWMKEGVTVMDPATTWIEDDVVIERDVTILPGTQLLGATVIREDAVVGPDTTLKDTEVGSGARVVRTHAELAVIGDGATVGPFSYLRPGTQIGASGKVGAFVETKNAVLGEGAKVPHLSYVGDATIGEHTNIGAGTIFANYDGVNKHHTTVGAHARTGSNNTFVAPVAIGDGAATGGGTVVREDVPAGALVVPGAKQRLIENWVLDNRAGTKQADAALAATHADGALEHS